MNVFTIKKHIKVKSIIFFILLFNNIVNAQIKTGIRAGFTTYNICNENQHFVHQKCNCNNTEIKSYDEIFKIENPGYNISLDLNFELFKLKRKLFIESGISLGYEYNHIKKVTYTIDSINFILLHQGKSGLGLNYLTNDIYIGLNLFKYIHFETGIQNRFLIYRNYASQYKYLKKVKSNVIIPKIYSDYYFSIGINYKGFIIKYRVLNFNKPILSETLEEGTNTTNELNTYLLSKIHEISFTVPIKEIKTNKLPLFEF